MYADSDAYPAVGNEAKAVEAESDKVAYDIGDCHDDYRT